MNKIILFKTDKNEIEVKVNFDGETVWLTQNQMSKLFGQTKQNISLHINNCFRENELLREVTVKDSLTVQKEGKRTVRR